MSALHTHLSRFHAEDEAKGPGVFLPFTCVICSAKCSTEKEYFQHNGHHFRSHETVVCFLAGCTFKTKMEHLLHTKAESSIHIQFKTLSQMSLGNTKRNFILPNETGHLSSSDTTIRGYY